MRALLSLAMVAMVAVPAAAESPAPAPAAPAKVPRVGIVIDVTVNVPAVVADGLGGALAAALAKQLKVDAVGGTEVSRRLPPGGLPEECISTPACVADLGKRLTADQLLFLGVVRIGESYQVDVTFVEVASGRQAARNRVQVQGDPGKAAEVFEAEAQRYLPDAELRHQGPDTLVINQGVGEGRRPIKPVVWAVGGVGAALVVGGGIVGLTGRSKFNSCDPDRCDQGEIDSVKTRLLLADLSMGVGVAAVVTAIVLYARTPRETPPPVQPAVTPTAGGAVLSLGGRF